MNEMTQEKFAQDLLKKRTIYLEGDVTQEMENRIGSYILWLNAIGDSEIILYIDSGSGDVEAGLNIYDILRNSKAPVTGIVFRYANSIAHIILQGCKKRKAFMHSTIKFDNIKVDNMAWHIFEDNLEEALRNIKLKQQHIYKILAQRTEFVSMDEIMGFCRKGIKLHSQEVKNFGWIDEII